MARLEKTKSIKKILEGTNFSVKQRNGRYIFERIENDYKFIPDFQILPNYESAIEWAKTIKKMY